MSDSGLHQPHRSQLGYLQMAGRQLAAYNTCKPKQGSCRCSTSVCLSKLLCLKSTQACPGPLLDKTQLAAPGSAWLLSPSRLSSLFCRWHLAVTGQKAGQLYVWNAMALWVAFMFSRVVVMGAGLLMSWRHMW